MKHILIFFFLSFAMNAYSQIILNVASKLSPGVLWVGVENPIVITGDTLNKNILLKSKDAEIRIEKGSFIAIVNSTNVNTNITIDAYDIISKDTTKLASKEFFIKRVPDPAYSIGGKIIDKTISRTSLLKNNKIDVVLGEGFPNGDKIFLLTSFDLEIGGKTFHSGSNTLTTSMIYYLKNTTNKSVRILNDRVRGFNETRLLYKDKTFILEE